MLYLRNTDALAGKAIIDDVFEWDVRNWSKALELWLPALRECALKNAHPKAIDIGGRNGGLSLLAAVEGFDVLCTDLTHPRESAHPLHRKHKVDHRVAYAALDITDAAVIEPHSGAYDVVLFKSILGGIGRNDRADLQLKTLRNMRTLLKPGGVLCYAENLEGARLHRFFRHRFTRWGKDWNYPSYPALGEMLNAAGFESQSAATGVLACFGRTEKQRNALGKVDQSLLNRAAPSRWKYIAYGVAKV
ncbi:MAG: class I SAM-dependent methyltransferase [Flavobacteriales bacterium]|jgi:SAM-dependent methyltransferase